MDTGQTIGIIMTVFFLIIAAMKKGTTSMEKPKRIKSFTIKLPIDRAMKAIISYAQNGGYKVDDFNETDGIIILSDSATISSYGAIYPVYLKKESDNSLLVEVGYKTKGSPIAIQNPVPHERFFNGIKTALYAVS